MLLTYLLYSVRDVDLYDGESYPLSDLIDYLSFNLLLLLGSLIVLIIAYFLVSKRNSLSNSQHWYYIQEDDKIWQKIVLVICWIVFIIGVLPFVFTIVMIIWKVVVGGALTILSWLLYWGLSIAIIIIFIALIPIIGTYIIFQKNKPIAILIGLFLMCGTISVVAYFWSDILDWSFMFPALEFHL